MKRFWVGSCALALIATGILLPAAADPGQSPTEPTAEAVQGFVVTRSDQAAPEVTDEQAQAVAAQTDRAVTETSDYEGDDVVLLDAPLEPAAATDFMVELAAQPGVELVEPIGIVTPSYVPYDPEQPQQWQLDSAAGINIAPVWDYTRGAGVTVAVLDSGSLPHDDLTWTGGYDFISHPDLSADGNGIDPDPTDSGWPTTPPADCGLWHGTMVGGLIGAQHNRLGIAGVAPEATLVPVRVMGTCGGDTLDLAKAIRWSAGAAVAGFPANPNPARVLNLSLGGVLNNSSGQPYCPTYLQSAIDQARGLGAVVVAASGNSGRSQLIEAPAICNGVIAVTSTNQDGNVSGWADKGSRVNIAAPGEYLLTTGNSGTSQPGHQGYSVGSGTSFSAPIVAGAIALMLSTNPGLSAAAAEAQLAWGAQPVNCTGCAGAGLLNTQSAVAVPGSAASDPIINLWWQRGGAASYLGQPRGAIFAAAGGRGQRYDTGHIYSSPTAGTFSVHGGIGDRHQLAGGIQGYLGFPTSFEIPIAGGVIQNFEKGTIYWTPGHGAYTVHGGVADRYRLAGGIQGYLGFPVSSEIPIAGGVVQYFERGTIYWTPSHGGYTVHGGVADRYQAAGDVQGYLGFPISSEIGVPGGVVQHFQRGNIYWTPTTGAFSVHGGVLTPYLGSGGPSGPLGMPISSEIPTGGGVVQYFQRGWIGWTPAGTGVHVG